MARSFMAGMLLTLLFNVWFSPFTYAQEQFSLKGTIFEEVATDVGIDPLLLYAIAITESAKSAGNGYITPHPYVFRSSAGPRFFKTKMEASTALDEILAETQHVDIGMMQINLHYHPQPNPHDLLDPLHNLTVAANYLKKAMASTDDPIIGVGRYHSWTKELASWYGERVWQTYRNLLQLADYKRPNYTLIGGKNE